MNDINDSTASQREGDTNDKRRFTEQYRPAAPSLFAWANVRIHADLRRKLDPEDLVQEVVCRAYDRFATYDSERGPFRAWLFGIANNVLREWLVRLRSQRPGEAKSSAALRLLLDAVPDEATSVSRRVARDESLQQFVVGLRELDSDERRLLVYRGLEGLSHAKVADVMGISVDAAEKRWQRLLKKLDDGTLSYDLFLR